MSKQILIRVTTANMNVQRRQVKSCLKIGSLATKMHCDLYQRELRCLLRCLELLPRTRTL